MGNDALKANPSNDVVQTITTRGSDWLWAVFATMTFTLILVFIWHLMVPRGQRVFHQLAMFILTTAAISYFCMASNLGYTPIRTEFQHANGFPAGTTRSIFYVRYIDWVITTPALLLELVLASGLPLSDIIALIYFDLVMIITGLVGALVVSSYKWAFWVFGTVAMFYIFWVLFGPARVSAGVLGAGYKKAFTGSASFLVVLWTLYPIAWGLADGGNVITSDGEMIFYGILDVLAKPVFTLFHLWQLSKLDLTALQLSSGKFSASAVGANHYDAEKVGRHHNAPVAIHDNERPVPHHSVASPQKKNFFGRKGKYDATGAAPLETGMTANHPTSTSHTAPRTSEHTVVA